MAKPRYINEDVISVYMQAGIDPKTGLPLKITGNRKSCLKDNIKMQLRLIDEADAVNRYIWYNLPCDLSSQELERLLYYKGQLCFFYFKELGKFFFMPYALDGNIDFYGRFDYVKPVPIADGASDAEKALIAKQAALLSMKHLKVYYDIPLEVNFDEDFCVLLHDYTKQFSQTIIPRQQVQDGLLDVMAECIPFMRTALLNSTGVQGMRVGNQDEYSNVKAASDSLTEAALKGDKYIAVIGATEFQDLTSGATSKGEEFLMAMQSLDNFRLSTYGLENGGLFEKKVYQNTAQTALNGGGQIGNPLFDGLAIRQRFCDIVNAIFGLGISCDISEVASGSDNNLDGMPYDEQDQSGTMQGQQPQGVEE
mgnify:CR=1 FL=1